MIENAIGQKKENLYKFRGKKILSDHETIRHLNYALALNGCEDRYVLIKEEKDGIKK